MPRILVVDDEPRLLKTTRLFLERAGHEVVTAGDLAGALRELRPGRFDACLIDVLLPDGQGHDLLRLAPDMGCHLPIILMTGEPNAKGAAQASELRAFAYVAKPLTKQTLLTVVGEAVARGRQHADRAPVRQDGLLR